MNKVKVNATLIKVFTATCAATAAFAFLSISGCSEDNGISSAFANQRKEAAPSVTDARDGKTYRTVKIGGVNWTAENANYKTDSSWCYGGIAANCEKYGRLYSWQDAAMKACPSGWRLPTSAELANLKDAVGGARGVMDKGWGGGADKFGWSALGGGYRVGGSGSFGYRDESGYWWGATEGSGDTTAYNAGIKRNSGEDYGNIGVYYDSKAHGLSVRCVEGASGAEKRYYVAFNVNGGIASGKNYALGVAGGQVFGSRFPNDPTRATYAFDGWFDEEDGGAVRYTASAAINKTMTLTARWRSVPAYTVMFNTAGGTPAAIASVVGADSGKALGASFPATMPAKADSIFTGWFDVSVAPVQYDDKTIINSNVTLTAVWRLLNRYTITFDANGASGSAPAAMAAQDSGKAVTLPDIGDVTKSGYTFGGWNTKSDGTGTTYNSGASYTVHGDVTLYVKWNAMLSGSIKVINDWNPNIVKLELSGGGDNRTFGNGTSALITKGSSYMINNVPGGTHTLTAYRILTGVATITVSSSQTVTVNGGTVTVTFND